MVKKKGKKAGVSADGRASYNRSFRSTFVRGRTWGVRTWLMGMCMCISIFMHVEQSLRKRFGGQMAGAISGVGVTEDA